ncbi:amidoligase family protein [Zobellella aerophila]|uniref:Alpha-L-fucosidase n=1 Tax=Zobellella aerophila TaxID=870480 RepID=A0ABP6VK22_9GAMM
MPLWLPEILHTRDGRVRRIGVELELTGLSLAQLARAIADTLGGQIRPISAYEIEIVDGPFGTFRTELDFDYLKRLARAQAEQQPGELEQAATDILGELAHQLAPLEVISPPLPVNELEQLDRLFTRLRQMGAKGTRHALHYAFGLHLNPELPDLSAETLLCYFKAYLCLHDWLDSREAFAPARKISPFIRAFGKDYCRQVLALGYWPDLARFTDDYLADNASRNRAMDLLPILAWHDEHKVRRAVRDDKVSQRPTLHYRLPNSDIDNPDWSLQHAWDGWLQVESLANDSARLDQVCRHYLAHLDNLTPDFIAPWKTKVVQWLR